MSNILNDLRLLEAKRASGVLSDAEFASQKAAILESVPESFEAEQPKAIPISQSKPDASLWETLMLCMIAAVLCGAATWAITGNLGMAATLAITVLAAFTIKLFTALD